MAAEDGQTGEPQARAAADAGDGSAGHIPSSEDELPRQGHRVYPYLLGDMEIARPRRRELPPIPPLKLCEAAKLMDSFEKPNTLAGIQTTADAIKSGQKEYGSAEERQTAQQPDEHKAVMRMFGALAKALNAGTSSGRGGRWSGGWSPGSHGSTGGWEKTKKRSRC